MEQEDENKKGYVYILDNPAFHGLVKVGKTTKDPEARARELSSGSGVPDRYAVRWRALVNDCHQVERLIHQRLAHARARNDREFFAIPLEEAISIASRIAAPFSCDVEKSAAGKRLAFLFAAILIVIVGGSVWLGSHGPERPQKPPDNLRPGLGSLGRERPQEPPDEIPQVIQLEPAGLEDSEKQTCLAQIEVTFRRRTSAKQGEKPVTVTVTNNSSYDFKGKVLLRSYDRDGDMTGNAEMDLTEGQGLRAGESATTTVIFQTWRWVAKVTRSVEGEFYRRVARPASPSPAQPKPSAPLRTPEEP